MEYITGPKKITTEISFEDKRFIEPFDFDKEYELMLERMKKRINRIQRPNDNN